MLGTGNRIPSLPPAAPGLIQGQGQAQGQCGPRTEGFLRVRRKPKASQPFGASLAVSSPTGQAFSPKPRPNPGSAEVLLPAVLSKQTQPVS